MLDDTEPPAREYDGDNEEETLIENESETEGDGVGDETMVRLAVRDTVTVGDDDREGLDVLAWLKLLKVVELIIPLADVETEPEFDGV